MEAFESQTYAMFKKLFKVEIRKIRDYYIFFGNKFWPNNMAVFPNQGSEDTFNFKALTGPQNFRKCITYILVKLFPII